MVKKLVLAIDRDDDLGRKAGIKSPVIGREENIKAAVKLATVDPEDSDVNTIFGAIKVYDKLKRKGEDVEIATVCGDEKVGVISDSKISEQLDQLLKITGASSVVVVTDGSEDEFVLPLVSSRFKIDAVSRVVVKQSKTIESTYFMIKKMLSDPKIARITLVPIGIILLVYSIFSIARYPEWGSGAIALALGLYLILKAYGLETSIENYFSALKTALVEGRISFITYVLSVMLLVIGVVQGIGYASSVYELYPAAGFVVVIASFLYSSIWWIVGGGVSTAIGRALDLIIEKKGFRKYVTISALLISTGLIFWGSCAFVLSGYGILNIPAEVAFQYLIFSVFAAVLLAFVVIVPSVME